MKVPVKLGIFAAVTAFVFAGAFGVGSVLDPVAPANGTVDLASADGDGDGDGDGEHNGSQHGGEDAEAESPEAAPQPANGSAAGPVDPDVPGLAVSDRGYTLQLDNPAPGSGEGVEVAFTIRSPDGGPVLNYRPTHEKEMHLIVVRRDLTGFQHLHPERAADGTWRVPVDLSHAGVYRFFADFAPAALSETLTLGTDVFVAGNFRPKKLPAPSTTWTGGDYAVEISGDPRAGSESELTFTATRDGAELSDLEPYLGAFGHLVSLRSGDLAYLHTHPAEDAGADEQGGPQIRFGTTFPTAGRYRLYLNFAHDGVVRTAEFTLDVPAGSGSASVSPTAPAAGSSEPESTEPGADDAEHSAH